MIEGDTYKGHFLGFYPATYGTVTWRVKVRLGFDTLYRDISRETSAGFLCVLLFPSILEVLEIDRPEREAKRDVPKRDTWLRLTVGNLMTPLLL